MVGSVVGVGVIIIIRRRIIIKDGLLGGPTWAHLNNLLGMFNSPLP